MKRIELVLIKTVNKLHYIRAIHAISEVCVLHFSTENEKKLKPLLSFFGIEYSTETHTGFTDVLDLITVDHSKPLTKIGELERPLIFANSLTNFLKNSWPEDKNLKFSFVGLFTKARKIVLLKWIKNLDSSIIYPFYLKYKPVTIALNLCNTFTKKKSLFYISASKRGREFPSKSFDLNYFKILLRSKFVLCPSGDFVWTYRFYESILCGAIPVIEEYCEVYEGYIFKYFNDDINSFQWSEEIALYNYKLCVSQITVSQEELSNLLLKNTGCNF
ncbi:hypothetical protein [Leeuwenhoekiella sp. MAR_2009_132]|uniref:hypothetical protein n=1 Tax=Leeuwenhoekiella sp. MAR_2009_132 TaxID=1392489 RepID=UPI00048B3129|nr:hypothetical protein [Leeuwenhoekiella sp. MAR_2009_132]